MGWTIRMLGSMLPGVRAVLRQIDPYTAWWNKQNQIAVAMSGIPGIHLIVEGHTDSDGSATYNLELSNQRAQTVIDYLVTTHGIDPARLSAVGYGEERPIADNSDADGRTANRRVDVIISTPENL